jgi:hypothetical protein
MRTMTTHRRLVHLLAGMAMGAVMIITPAHAEETPAPEPTPSSTETSTPTPTPDPTSAPTPDPATPAESAPSTVTIDPPVLYLDQTQFFAILLVLVVQMTTALTALIVSTARRTV